MTLCNSAVRQFVAMNMANMPYNTGEVGKQNVFPTFLKQENNRPVQIRQMQTTGKKRACPSHTENNENRRVRTQRQISNLASNLASNITPPARTPPFHHPLT